MVNVRFHPHFERAVRSIRDGLLKERVRKQIERIVLTPELGKPMRFARAGTRELHIPPFRISYACLDDELVFLDFYHKDEQ